MNSATLIAHFNQRLGNRLQVVIFRSENGSGDWMAHSLWKKSGSSFQAVSLREEVFEPEEIDPAIPVVLVLEGPDVLERNCNLSPDEVPDFLSANYPAKGLFADWKVEDSGRVERLGLVRESVLNQVISEAETRNWMLRSLYLWPTLSREVGSDTPGNRMAEALRRAASTLQLETVGELLSEPLREGAAKEGVRLLVRRGKWVFLPAATLLALLIFLNSDSRSSDFEKRKLQEVTREIERSSELLTWYSGSYYQPTWFAFMADDLAALRPRGIRFQEIRFSTGKEHKEKWIPGQAVVRVDGRSEKPEEVLALCKEIRQLEWVAVADVERMYRDAKTRDIHFVVKISYRT